MADRYDVVVIGAGLIGSSVAWRLVSQGCSSVALLDVDLAGLYSSSELSAGGVRSFWSNPADIELSRISIDFYQTIREEVDFRQRGYLWLHDEATWDLVRTHDRLRNDPRLGIEYLTAEEGQRRAPEVDDFEGVLGATFSPKDGLINSNVLKQYYRARAMAGGAALLDHHMVTGVDAPEEGPITLKVATFEVDADNEEEILEQILTSHSAPDGSTERTIQCDALVNAAGAWAGPVAALFGETLEARPFRRQISLVHSRSVSLRGYGMLVLPGGLYCHPEAGHTLCGWRDPEEKEGYTFKYGSQSFFLKEIQPRLSSRISGFEKTRHMGGWAGLTAETADGSGVLGHVPGHPNIVEAVGFTGKGLTQSYAVGVCVADLVLHGRYIEIDGSGLSRRRFESGTATLDPLLL